MKMMMSAIGSTAARGRGVRFGPCVYAARGACYDAGRPGRDAVTSSIRFAPRAIARTRLALIATAAALGVIAASASPARAQDAGRQVARPSWDGLEVTDGFSGDEGTLHLPIGLGASVETIDREGGATETLLVLRARAALRFWRISAALEADVRFDDDFELRRRDYDERSDYLRFIDYVRVGDRGDVAWAQLGRLHDASIGHGTIVGHYYSDIDIDSPLCGLTGGIDLGWIGAEYLTNDVTYWNLQAGRVYLAPLRFTRARVLEHLRVGATVAADFTAPRTLENDGGIPRLDGDENFQAREDPIVVYGLDVEWPLIAGDAFSVTPYADYDVIASHGSGAHLGAIAGIGIPFVVDLEASARLEYRVFQDEYIGTYFDAFYEVERFQYPELGSLGTKRGFIDDQGSSRGWLAEVRLEVPNLARVAASYEDMDGNRDDRLDLFAEVTIVDWLRVQAHFHKRDIAESERLFDFDEQTFVRAKVIVNIWKGLHADVGFTHAWVIDEDRRRFESVDVWSVGALWAFAF